MPTRGTEAGEGEFARLLDGARRRDPACLRELHDSVVRPVAAYLRVGGAADAAGSTNEVLFRALTNLQRFQGDEDRFRAWVLTIAHHLLVDERRARGRRPAEVPLVDEAAQQVAAPDDPAAASERSAGTAAVLAAVAALPESQRTVITLRWVGGLSLAEVADVLGCKVGAVKALQHRAVETLRARAVTRHPDLTFTTT